VPFNLENKRSLENLSGLSKLCTVFVRLSTIYTRSALLLRSSLSRDAGDVSGGYAILDLPSSILGRRLARVSAALCLGLLGAVTVFPVRAGVAQSDGDATTKLPMYGQPEIARPEDLKKTDEAFIRDATFRFGSRGAASRALSEQGWANVRQGMLDVAMRRFNEAWLLNPKNYQAFWGFGAVLSEQGKLTAAIEQLETARELIDEPKQKVLLLCDLGTVHSVYAVRLPADKQLDRAQHFVIANNRFAESLEIDPNSARSWRDWAISLYEQERYSEAWLRAKRAIELKAQPFPPNFLESLRKKVAEAK
jgi:tetratricopeptide (TPR) repeat protein